MRTPIILVLAALVAGIVALALLRPFSDPGEPSEKGTPRATEPEPPAVEPVPDPDAQADAPVGGGVLTGFAVMEGGSRAAGSKILAFPLGDDLWKLSRSDIGPAMARADELGRFTIAALSPGFYQVEARSGDARGVHPLVRVREGARSSVVVRITPPSAIEGYVVREDGLPVADATVTTDMGGVLRSFFAANHLPDLSFGESVETMTDANGAFRLYPLPKGRYDLEVEGEGFVAMEVPAVDAPVDGIRVVALRSYSVPGKLTAPLRTKVRIHTIPELASLELSGSGPFVLDGLVQGRFQVVATAPGMADARTEVSIEPGRGIEPILLRMERGTRVDLLRPVKRTIALLRLEQREGRERLVERHRFQALKKSTRFILAPGMWAFRDVSGGREDFSEYLEVYERSANHYGLSTKAQWRSPEGRYVPLVRVAGRALTLVVGGWSEHGYDLFGRVLYASGWPAADAAIVLRRWSDPPDRFFKATVRGPTRDGRFRVKLGRFLLVGAHRPDVPPGGADTVWSSISHSDGEVLLVLPLRSAAIVRGRVVNEESDPVPGAFVVFADGTATTDIDGRFERRRVHPGVHAVRYFAAGHTVSFSDSFFAKAGETNEIADLVLARETVEIRGRVHAPDGASIPGARVWAKFMETRTEYSAITGRDGKYVVRGPGGAEKEVVIRVAAHGYMPGEKTIRIQPGVERADFELSPMATLTGRVRFKDPSDEPVMLRLTTESGRFLDLAVRLDDRRQEWTAEDVPPGKVGIVLRCGDLAPYDFGSPTLAPGSVRRLGDVELMRGGTISGRANREGVRIGIEGLKLETKTNSAGFYQLRPVPAGHRTLTADREWGKGQGASPVRIRDGDHVELNLRFW